MKVEELLLQLVFPDFCLNCRRLGPLLCRDCYHSLKFYFSQHKTQEIKEHFEELYFDDLQIMANFSGAFAKLIKAFKYQNGKNIAPFLAKMLYRHLIIKEADLITFIPLHPLKLRLRGFNQGQEIALRLAKILNIPAKNLLQKNINNQAQAQIKNQQERLERMRGLFKTREKYSNLIKNKQIILLDDVCTTGATFNAASQALKKTGAKQVFCLSLASKIE